MEKEIAWYKGQADSESNPTLLFKAKACTPLEGHSQITKFIEGNKGLERMLGAHSNPWAQKKENKGKKEFSGKCKPQVEEVNA